MLSRSALPTRVLLLSKARQPSPYVSAFSSSSRQLSSKAKEPEKPKLGKPYKELSIGVIKETFPLEKRVAATPEVSDCVEISRGRLSADFAF